MCSFFVWVKTKFFPPRHAHFDKISQEQESQLGNFHCKAIMILGSEKKEVHFKASCLTNYSFLIVFCVFFLYFSTSNTLLYVVTACNSIHICNKKTSRTAVLEQFWFLGMQPPRCWHFPHNLLFWQFLVIATTACRSATAVRGKKGSGGKSQLQPPLLTVMSVDLLNEEFCWTFCHFVRLFGAI